MIPLFAAKRRPQLLILLGVALAELAATIVVARSLHAPFGQQSALVLSIATMAAFGLQILQRRLCEAVGLSYTAAVRRALFRHLMSADPEVVRNRRHGAMLQSFVGDLTSLRQWVSEGLVRGVLAFVALIGMLAWMASSEPRLALLLGGISIIIAAGGAALLPALSQAVRTVRRERGRVAAFASERLAAQPTVQAFGRAKSEAQRLDRRVDRLNRASLRRAWLTGAMRALPHLATTAMLATVVLVDRVAGSTGVIGSVVVVGILGLALRDLARAGELMIPGTIAMARIASLLDLPLQTRARGGTRSKSGETGLVLDGVQVARGTARFSAMADAGEVVLLQGAPEVRSQLFAILSGRQRAVRGVARWEGSNLLALAPAKLRRLVGIASPELPLLAGSAAMNIRYRAADLGDDDLEAIAADWAVEVAGRRGDPHRVSLLRAIAGSPPLLLLDLAATPLPDGDLLRLRQAIAGWPGVVLISTEQRALQQLATRTWQLGTHGLSERSIAATEGLRLIDAAAARGNP